MPAEAAIDLDDSKPFILAVRDLGRTQFTWRRQSSSTSFLFSLHSLVPISAIGWCFRLLFVFFTALFRSSTIHVRIGQVIEPPVRPQSYRYHNHGLYGLASHTCSISCHLLSSRCIPSAWSPDRAFANCSTLETYSIALQAVSPMTIFVCCDKPLAVPRENLTRDCQTAFRHLYGSYALIFSSFVTLSGGDSQLPFNFSRFEKRSHFAKRNRLCGFMSRLPNHYLYLCIHAI